MADIIDDDLMRGTASANLTGVRGLAVPTRRPSQPRLNDQQNVTALSWNLERHVLTENTINIGKLYSRLSSFCVILPRQ